MRKMRVIRSDCTSAPCRRPGRPRTVHATLAVRSAIPDSRFNHLLPVSAPNIETIVSLAKRRGFVYPSSEIYGGLGSAWDYGPMGIELYNNVKQAWWRWMVYERDDIE